MMMKKVNTERLVVKYENHWWDIANMDFDTKTMKIRRNGETVTVAFSEAELYKLGDINEH